MDILTRASLPCALAGPVSSVFSAQERFRHRKEPIRRRSPPTPGQPRGSMHENLSNPCELRRVLREVMPALSVLPVARRSQ